MRKNRLFAFSGCLLALSISTASAGPISNEQVVINATARAVDSVYTRVTPQDLNIISDSGSLDKLVLYGISEGMRGKFDRIMLAQGPESSGYNLYFDVLGFDLGYRMGSSRGFLRGRKIRRELQCELRINIRDGRDGALRETKNLGVSYVDEIDRSEISFVNSRKIPELAPEPPGSSWSRYAEPSLVVASVGALVYLFFANR